MGTNCGLTDPDELARVNFVANDLGIDTIEAGAMIAVLMEVGQGAFGDVNFMLKVLEEIRGGSENGRIWARGLPGSESTTGLIGYRSSNSRQSAPTIRALSRGTGITMMMTAQGRIILPAICLNSIAGRWRHLRSWRQASKRSG